MPEKIDFYKRENQEILKKAEKKGKIFQKKITTR